MRSPAKPRRSRCWVCLVLGLLWPAVGGCHGAIVGDWYLAEAVPNRQVFALDNVQFRRDGTFSATTTVEGVTTSEEGTYEFNGFNLKLQPRSGGLRSYSASLQPGQLQLSSGQRKVVLKQGKKGGR